MSQHVGVYEFAVAADLSGIRWCREAGCDYKGGVVEPGVVHMRRLRYTPTGLHAFLVAAYDARWGHHPEVRALERWERRYRRMTWVNVMAGDLGRKLPRKAWELDRAKMREELSEYATRVPAHARPYEYGRAVRWGARS